MWTRECLLQCPSVAGTVVLPAPSCWLCPSVAGAILLPLSLWCLCPNVAGAILLPLSIWCPLLPVQFCCQYPSDAGAPLLPVPFCCQYPLMPVPLCCRCHFVASIPLMPVPLCCRCHLVASTFLCPSFVSALLSSMFLCYFLIMPVFYVACVPLLCALLLPVPSCCLCLSVAGTILLPIPFCCRDVFWRYPFGASAFLCCFSCQTFLLPQPFSCKCLFVAFLRICCQWLFVASTFLLPEHFCFPCLSVVGDWRCSRLLHYAFLSWAFVCLFLVHGGGSGWVGSSSHLLRPPPPRPPPGPLAVIHSYRQTRCDFRSYACGWVSGGATSLAVHRRSRHVGHGGRQGRPLHRQVHLHLRRHHPAAGRTRVLPAGPGRAALPGALLARARHPLPPRSARLRPRQRRSGEVRPPGEDRGLRLRARRSGRALLHGGLAEQRSRRGVRDGERLLPELVAGGGGGCAVAGAPPSPQLVPALLPAAAAPTLRRRPHAGARRVRGFPAG